MYLLTLVLGIVLLPEASTLKCYECVPGLDGNCIDTTTQCPSEKNQCAALRLVSYIGGSEVLNVNAKLCVLSEECGQHSLNTGLSRDILNVKCCSTNLCNTQPAPEPSKTNPNDRKCFTCVGETCNTTLNCEGNEDHCMSATVSIGGLKVALKGCTSKVFCTNKELAQIIEGSGTEMSCCQGDYCNSAGSTSISTTASASTTVSTSTSTTASTTTTPNTSSSTSAGLMLLVAPLISLVLG